MATPRPCRRAKLDDRRPQRIPNQHIAIAGRLPCAIVYDTGIDRVPLRQQVPQFFADDIFHAGTGVEMLDVEANLCFCPGHDALLGNLAGSHQGVAQAFLVARRGFPSANVRQVPVHTIPFRYQCINMRSAR